MSGGTTGTPLRARGREGHAADELLVVEDVAAMLGWAISTVQEKCVRGLIPNRRLPGTRRCLIPRSDLQAWLDGAELETVRLARGGRICRPKAA